MFTASPAKLDVPVDQLKSVEPVVDPRCISSLEVLLMHLWNPILRLCVMSSSSQSPGNFLNGSTDKRHLRESGALFPYFLRPIRKDTQEISMTDDWEASANFDLISRFHRTPGSQDEIHLQKSLTPPVSSTDLRGNKKVAPVDRLMPLENSLFAAIAGAHIHPAGRAGFTIGGPHLVIDR